MVTRVSRTRRAVGIVVGSEESNMPERHSAEIRDLSFLSLPRAMHAPGCGENEQKLPFAFRAACFL